MCHGGFWPNALVWFCGPPRVQEVWVISGAQLCVQGDAWRSSSLCHAALPGSETERPLRYFVIRFCLPCEQYGGISCKAWTCTTWFPAGTACWDSLDKVQVYANHLHKTYLLRNSFTITAQVVVAILYKVLLPVVESWLLSVLVMLFIFPSSMCIADCWSSTWSFEKVLKQQKIYIYKYIVICLVGVWH